MKSPSSRAIWNPTKDFFESLGLSRQPEFQRSRKVNIWTHVERYPRSCNAKNSKEQQITWQLVDPKSYSMSYLLFSFFLFFFQINNFVFFVLLICTLLTIKTTIYSGKTMIPGHWSNEWQSLCQDLSNPPTHMRNIAYTNQSLSIQGRL